MSAAGRARVSRVLSGIVDQRDLGRLECAEAHSDQLIEFVAVDERALRHAGRVLRKGLTVTFS